MSNFSVKHKSFWLMVGFLVFSLFLGCTPDQPLDEQESDIITFDSTKAQAYGADDYGMRKYIMAFLKRGPNRDLSPEKAMELQRAHMANIGRMADLGKLVVAGPFLGDGDLRGIYIFNVENLEEARALTESDPAIQAGSLEMELLEWYGSAALMATPEIHPRIAKIDL